MTGVEAQSLTIRRHIRIFGTGGSIATALLIEVS